MKLARSVTTLLAVSLLSDATLIRRSRSNEEPASEEPKEVEGMKEMEAGLVDCSAYNTPELCVKGERRARCEWLEMFKCSKIEAKPEPEPLTGPECEARSDSMNHCQSGFHCVFDTITGQCHAAPAICDQIECGEERNPPVPLQCLPPLKKQKPEGSCCFICK